MHVLRGLAPRFLVTVVVALTCAAPAHSQIIQLLTHGDITPGLPGAVYPEPAGTFISSPYQLDTLDNIFTFTNESGGSFLRADLVGEKFLYNGPFVPGPVDISFALPIKEFGIDLLSNAPGLDTFSFTAFDGAAALGTFTTSGQFGTLLFAGLREIGTGKITRIRFSSHSNDFLTCDARYRNVPEPSAPALFVTGALTGLGLCVRRKLRCR